MKYMKRPLSFLIALLIVLPLFLSGQPAQAIAGGGVAKSSYRAYGADLSSWNVNGSALNYSLIDFAKMKADGCQFVILRIGYEGSVSRNNTMDLAFLEYYKRARAAGMPMGIYFYSLTTTYNGAVEDANWVADQIEKNGMYFEYPIFYDVEDGAQTALGSSAMEQLCLGWCETLEKRGYFPGIYGGGTQVINKLSSNFKSKYDIWYPIVLNSGHGNQYDPNAYDRSDYCNMWQYAWYDCNYDGVGLDMLDVNVCYKNYPAIMSQYGYNNCAVMNTAPTIASVSLKKDAYAVDETLTFSVSANGTSTKLYIKRVDGQWENTYDVGSSFNLAFGWKGAYEAYVVTTNAKGSKTSSSIYFHIGPPTVSKITASKSQYQVGETAKFTLDCDGSTNTVWIYYPDGTSKYTQNLSTSFSTTFTQAGDYQALVESWNGEGSLCSEKISFKVVSDQPTSASVSVSKSTFNPGENVVFTCAGNGKTNTLWIYYPDGTSKYYQNVGTSKTLTFTAVGKYEALVETWNQSGSLSFISDKISFNIANPTSATTTKPTTQSTTTKPTTQSTTTKPTTQSTTTKPTTVTTTKPTTVTTTKPTTVTTTKPTMTTTKKPTTVSISMEPSRTIEPTTVGPSTGHDCAIDGHRFVMGWCQICNAADPLYVGPPVTSEPTTAPTTASTTVSTTVLPQATTMPQVSEGNPSDQANSGQLDDYAWVLIVIAFLLVLVMPVLGYFLLKKKK